MAAIYSNGGNRWNILGFNFTKRDALSSVYKISLVTPWNNKPLAYIADVLNTQDLNVKFLYFFKVLQFSPASVS
jgi:hypothetical protein